MFRSLIIALMILFFFALPVSIAEENPPSSTQKTSLAGLSENKKPFVIGAQAPTKNDFVKSGSKALIYCFGLFLVSLALKKKLQTKKDKNTPNPINIVAKKAISSRTALVLVEVDGKKLLLSQSPDSLHLISELDDGNLFAKLDTAVNTEESLTTEGFPLDFAANG